MRELQVLMTEWYWLLMLGMLVTGISLVTFGNRLRRPSRFAGALTTTGVVFLMLFTFLASGIAGLMAIVVIDFAETFPKLGFLSRLVLYYLLVLPTAALLAEGIRRLAPMRPKWIAYATFGLGVAGGTYFLFSR